MTPTNVTVCNVSLLFNLTDSKPTNTTNITTCQGTNETEILILSEVPVHPDHFLVRNNSNSTSDPAGRCLNGTIRNATVPLNRTL